MTKKEVLWHTKYKHYWYLTGCGLFLLGMLLGCVISPWFAYLLIPGIFAIVYAGKDDD